jgi:hypothetical protein
MTKNRIGPANKEGAAPHDTGFSLLSWLLGRHAAKSNVILSIIAKPKRK